MDSGLAQLLLEHSPDPLLLIAPDGSITFLNAAAGELFGYTRAQLLGAESSLLLGEGSREPFHGVLSGLHASTPRSGQPFAGSGRRADGTEIPVEITCSLLPSDAGTGSPAGFVALSVRGAGHRRAAPGAGSAAGNLPVGHGATGHGAAGTSAGGGRPGFAGATGDAGAPGRSIRAASMAVPAAFAAHDDELRAGVLRDPLTSLPNGTLFNDRLGAALRQARSRGCAAAEP
ncbi:PAS domain S-box protein [Pseudarthrobacter sp. So.54]